MADMESAGVGVCRRVAEPGIRTEGFCDKLDRNLADLGKWSTWKAVLLGQCLSLLLCTTGVTSQYINTDYGIYMPTAQNFLSYVLLCTVYTTWLACRTGDGGLIPVLRDRGWKYMVVAAVDVEANFLVVKAYHYTTLTSAQLLDCFSIPTVLALSWLVLKVRYKLVHILGVGVCLLGVGCLVWADIEEGRGNLGAGKNRLLGDMLCLAGAALYGISNIAQEFVVKTFDSIEFLGMMGLFGSVINGIQLAVLEHQEVAGVRWDVWQPVVLLAIFALAQFLFYSITPVVMRLSSATAFNLSVLSADFYSLMAGIYLFQYKFHALYFLSFFLVMTGVIIYSIKPTPIASQQAHYRAIARDNTTTVDLELMSSVHGSLHGSTPCGEIPMALTSLGSSSESEFYSPKGRPVHIQVYKANGSPVSLEDEPC